MDFELVSDYQPTGDQPEAIAQLTEGVLEGAPAQTLLGVTGSGKTFTIANVIKNVNKPTLILSHNKTLAAQLYGEFKNFFPHNAVEYYVSYYDYYQPEAYLPSTDTYIEKDLAINDEIDKLRLAATSALLSGRKDVVVVSSVSCIYGMGNPADFYDNVIDVRRGQKIDRNVFLRRLVDSLYVRNDMDLNRGNFRVKGDTVDIFLAYSDNLLRVVFWDDEIDAIEEVDPVSGHRIMDYDEFRIYPANLFMTTKESTLRAIHQIEDDLTKHVAHEDASFTTTWSIDLHRPDPKNSRYFPNQEFKAVTTHILIYPYPVPYRCLYSRNVDNLFMAGRNISVTHVALGTVRVMRTTGMMGEVVGMAASLCKKYDTTPRGVYRYHLNDLKALMKEGVNEKGLPNNQQYNEGGTLNAVPVVQ